MFVYTSEHKTNHDAIFSQFSFSDWARSWETRRKWEAETDWDELREFISRERVIPTTNKGQDVNSLSHALNQVLLVVLNQNVNRERREESRASLGSSIHRSPSRKHRRKEVFSFFFTRFNLVIIHFIKGIHQTMLFQGYPPSLSCNLHSKALSWHFKSFSHFYRSLLLQALSLLYLSHFLDCVKRFNPSSCFR